jgi:hypothetical protein
MEGSIELPTIPCATVSRDQKYPTYVIPCSNLQTSNKVAVSHFPNLQQQGEPHGPWTISFVLWLLAEAKDFHWIMKSLKEQNTVEKTFSVFVFTDQRFLSLVQ